MEDSMEDTEITNEDVMSPEEVDAEFDKFLEPTGWTIDQWHKELEKQPWYSGKLKDLR
tara:strand:+ start:147 stop:320 length:174 start_codon:yes stop_codon:yes gene_type:complete